MRARSACHVLLSIGLLAVACSGPTQPGSPAAVPTSPGSAGLVPVVDEPGTDDEAVRSQPPTASAATVAARFAEAWVRRSDDPARWWTAIRPWCEDGLVTSLRGADPATIPASRVTSTPRPAGGSPQSGLQFDVTTDAGVLVITVAAIGDHWLVSDVDFARSGA